MARPRKVSNAAAAPSATPAAPALDIQINLDGLTIGDLRLFRALKDGTVDDLDLVNLLDRCVVGGVDHLPLSSMTQIAQALSQAIAASGDPKN